MQVAGQQLRDGERSTVGRAANAKRRRRLQHADDERAQVHDDGDQAEAGGSVEICGFGVYGSCAVCCCLHLASGCALQPGGLRCHCRPLSLRRSESGQSFRSGVQVQLLGHTIPMAAHGFRLELGGLREHPNQLIPCDSPPLSPMRREGRTP